MIIAPDKQIHMLRFGPTKYIVKAITVVAIHILNNWMINGWMFQRDFAKIAYAKVNTIAETTLAAAAPSTPQRGIHKAFKITFITAVAATTNILFD